MSVALAAMLSAVVAAGSGPPFPARAEPVEPRAATAGELVALAGVPAVRETVTAALPPPPKIVVRETRSFGTVTIDHARHLALRAPCANCHGPGRVTKIEFTPKIAHERCVGCHKEREAGPTACGGCHVKGAGGALAASPGAAAPSAPATARPEDARVPPSPRPTPPADAGGEGDSAAEEHRGPAAEAQPTPPRGGAAASPEEPAADGAPPEGAEEERPAPGLPPPPPPVTSVPPPPAGPFPGAVTAPPAPAAGLPRRQMLELGLSGPGVGPSVRLTERRDRFFRAYGIERLESAHSARILALLDLGVVVPIRERWAFVSTWIAGVDAQERPDLGLSGALGLRARVEWTPPARWHVALVHFSVAGIRDFPRGAVGVQHPASRVVATLGASIALPSRR